MKRFLRSTICLMLVMLLSLGALTVPASAACYHYTVMPTTKYMNSNGRYYLNKDITLAGDITVLKGTTKLCLNGYDLTVGSYGITVVDGATLEICDCTGGGAICTENKSSGTSAITVNSGGILKFTGGGMNMTDTSTYGCYTYGINNAGGTVNITGGTFTASSSAAGGSSQSSTQAIICADAGTTNISGGTFTADVSTTSSNGTVRAICVWGSGGEVNITGGSFIGDNYSAILSRQRCPFPILNQGSNIRLGGTPDISGIVGFYTFNSSAKTYLYAVSKGLNYEGDTIQIGCVNGAYYSHTPIVYDVTKGVNDTKFVLNSQNSGSGKLNLYTDKLIYDFGSYYCSGGSTGVITKDSTCSEYGVKTYTCSVCGRSRTETIYKKSHTPGPEATAATPQICTVCGKVLKPATLYDGEIILEFEEVIYDGTEQEPTVTLGELIEGQDYEVTYSDNIEIGTAKVIITGIGDYSGTIEVEFEIIDDPVVPGDTDLDGEVDSDDLTALARHVAGIVLLTDSNSLANADVTLDGAINADDLTRLAQYVAGIITSW